MWDDCLRTNKFPVISTTNKGQVTFVDLVGATNGSGATFKATDLVWPIPVEEIQRNPNLTQTKVILFNKYLRGCVKSVFYHLECTLSK